MLNLESCVSVPPLLVDFDVRPEHNISPGTLIELARLRSGEGWHITLRLLLSTQSRHPSHQPQRQQPNGRRTFATALKITLLCCT